MRRARRLALMAVLGALIVAAVRWIQPPTVPAGAASAALVRTELTGRVSLDSELGDPATGPASPTGGECLPRLERPAGWLDLCWQAYRYSGDADPAKDYYVLRVHGSFQGTGIAGVRWLVVRSRLVGTPIDGVFMGWPEGGYYDGCKSVPVDLVAAAPAATETLCDRTTGETREAPYGTDVTWTCAGCLLGTTDAKAIALWNVVAVKTGTVPAWDIYADLGG